VVPHPETTALVPADTVELSRAIDFSLLLEVKAGLT
jgi:hypothetical protein